MDKLPDMCIVEIFVQFWKHVHDEELYPCTVYKALFITRCRLVCKKFHKILSNNIFWMHIIRCHFPRRPVKKFSNEKKCLFFIFWKNIYLTNYIKYGFWHETSKKIQWKIEFRESFQWIPFMDLNELEEIEEFENRDT